MNNSFFHLACSVFIGIGATLTFDLWVLFLKQTFKIVPSNFCLVGRWILYMPEGIFRHSNIGSVPQKSGECTIGWITHYLTGVAFAVMFLAFAGSKWISTPRILPALIFGIITVSAPFLVMQPALGLGVAASKTSNPVQTRLRSLLNHTAFGFGIYLFGWLAQWWL